MIKSICDQCGKIELIDSMVFFNTETRLCNKCYVERLIQEENENILRWENKRDAKQEQRKIR